MARRETCSGNCEWGENEVLELEEFMGSVQSSEKLVHKILYGTGDLDHRDIESLDVEQRYECIELLFAVSDVNPRVVGKVMSSVCKMIPYVSTDKRFSALTRMIALLHSAEDVFGREFYNMFDEGMVNSFMPLELISLAHLLSEGMQTASEAIKEVSLWGLVRVIPHLHPVNQKEFALDIYEMHTHPLLRSTILEALNSLIYSMDQHSRSAMTFFFAETLKRDEEAEAKYFALDLLKKVTPALPENDRLVIADTVAPLIFFSDTRLVRRSIDYFAEAIHLLPAEDRFHYTEIVAGLINDVSVRSEVVRAIYKALPFLAGDSDRGHFSELIRQYQGSSGAHGKGTYDHDDGALETAYYYYID